MNIKLLVRSLLNLLLGASFGCLVNENTKDAVLFFISTAVGWIVYALIYHHHENT